MTREEAIWILNEDLEWAEQNRYPYISEQKQEALEIAIKALEQENVLDKIRAEIVEMRSKKNCSCSDCIDIIDKYRKEHET